MMRNDNGKSKISFNESCLIMMKKEIQEEEKNGCHKRKNLSGMQIIDWLEKFVEICEEEL